jgi:hypothetical protein
MCQRRASGPTEEVVIGDFDKTTAWLQREMQTMVCYDHLGIWFDRTIGVYSHSIPNQRFSGFSSCAQLRTKTQRSIEPLELWRLKVVAISLPGGVRNF